MSSKCKKSCISLVAAALFAALSACDPGDHVITEDFTTLDHADLAASTGVWNVVDHVAQAGAAAGGNAARTLSFGNGGDGALDTPGGFIFDTDAHPSGYDFLSVRITAGSVVVRGANPLLIRSLGPVTIVPAISIAGGNGADGAQVADPGTLAGGAGGTAIAAGSTGGAGGDAAATSPDVDGKDGLLFDGSDGDGIGGAGSNASVTQGNAGFGSTASAPQTDFDVAANFIAGAGGGGGGGHDDTTTPDATHASGGGGGAGGGAIRISAVGDIVISAAIDARGGNGGSAAASSAQCSGYGAGGGGGGVWLQSLHGVSTPAPLLTGGTRGNPAGPCAVSPPDPGSNGLDGLARADGTSRPTWAATSPPNYDLTLAAPSQSYTVQSKAYDLHTLNADFPSAPDISKQPQGGSIGLVYQGSIDGTTWSDATSDITTLSNRKYRYVRFTATIQTAATAEVSPSLSRVSIHYRDFGVDPVDLSLSPGCGTLARVKGDRPAGQSGRSGAAGFTLMLILMAFARVATRARRRSAGGLR